MLGRSLFIGAAALALGAASTPVLAADVAPEPALSSWSGQIEAWAGYMFLENERGNFNPDDTDFLAFGVDGRVRIDLAEALSMQLDASYDNVGEGDHDGYEDGTTFGGHLSWSDPDSFLIGAFGGWGQGDTRSSDTWDAWIVGGEAQFYLDAVTLYGQVGYMDGRRTDSNSDVHDDAFHNAWFGRAVGRYFFSPDTRLQAEFSYANGEQDTDNKDMEVFGWGARIDHQVFDKLSIFAAYDGNNYDNGDGGDTGAYTEHTVRGGISILFGRPDLLSADRTGPSLDLPRFGRWAAGGDNVD